METLEDKDKDKYNDKDKEKRGKKFIKEATECFKEKYGDPKLPAGERHPELEKFLICYDLNYTFISTQSELLLRLLFKFSITAVEISACVNVGLFFSNSFTLVLP